MREAPGGGYRVWAKLPVNGLPNGLLCRYLEAEKLSPPEHPMSDSQT
jgi:hypothetical protein